MACALLTVTRAIEWVRNDGQIIFAIFAMDFHHFRHTRHQFSRPFAILAIFAIDFLTIFAMMA